MAAHDRSQLDRRVWRGAVAAMRCQPDHDGRRVVWHLVVREDRERDGHVVLQLRDEAPRVGRSGGTDEETVIGRLRLAGQAPELDDLKALAVCVVADQWRCGPGDASRPARGGSLHVRGRRRPGRVGGPHDHGAAGRVAGSVDREERVGVDLTADRRGVGAACRRRPRLADRNARFGRERRVVAAPDDVLRDARGRVGIGRGGPGEVDRSPGVRRRREVCERGRLCVVDDGDGRGEAAGRVVVAERADPVPVGPLRGQEVVLEVRLRRIADRGDRRCRIVSIDEPLAHIEA